MMRWTKSWLQVLSKGVQIVGTRPTGLLFYRRFVFLQLRFYTLFGSHVTSMDIQ